MNISDLTDSRTCRRETTVPIAIRVSASHHRAEPDTGISEHFEINEIRFAKSIELVLFSEIQDACEHSGVSGKLAFEIVQRFALAFNLGDHIDQDAIVEAENEMLEAYHQTDP